MHWSLKRAMLKDKLLCIFLVSEEVLEIGESSMMDWDIRQALERVIGLE